MTRGIFAFSSVKPFCFLSEFLIEVSRPAGHI